MERDSLALSSLLALLSKTHGRGGTECFHNRPVSPWQVTGLIAMRQSF